MFVFVFENDFFGCSIENFIMILNLYYVKWISVFFWVNRLIIREIKNFVCSGFRFWGILEFFVRFLAVFWIYWFFFLFVVNSIFKGRWIFFIAEVYLVLRLCWRGFIVVGGIWLGFEFYLFWEDLVVSINRLYILNVYFRKWRYIVYSFCMLVYWIVIYGFILFYKVIFRLEIWI